VWSAEHSCEASIEATSIASSCPRRRFPVAVEPEARRAAAAAFAGSGEDTLTASPPGAGGRAVADLRPRIRRVQRRLNGRRVS